MEQVQRYKWKEKVPKLFLESLFLLCCISQGQVEFLTSLVWLPVLALLIFYVLLFSHISVCIDLNKSHDVEWVLTWCPLSSRGEALEREFPKLFLEIYIFPKF